MTFTLVTILKALLEIAGLSLLGQAILYVFAGAGRDRNFVYLLFRTVTRPVFLVTRFLTPRFVLDRHVWLLTPLLVFGAWMIVTWIKIGIALDAARAVQ